ncbi:DNA cytosine methyltransferase [Clostridium sp. BL-8]|uniref:DNA cytosine methyltransferase n=1 Tax=Clostridium sp. BL-8 TaxID=349938 RepID=UPI00098C5A45|nr:DNA cytosine methyltransferase [Clostridium sp. BL-8]OOM79130.1 putative BsuMI modification methylase subunit YdiO [Clostridium sp. BL-8]
MKKVDKVAVDLFSGAGGVSCGLEKAGIEVSAAVELWGIAANTYERNFGENKVIRKDIRNVKGKEILKKIGVRKNRLFLLAGCPPCQGFSSQQKNKKGEDDERNLLVFEYFRIINEIRPVFILMENVPGLKNEKNIFDKLLKMFNEIGYEVRVEVLNAVNYGVPQTRKRLVLHGVRKDVYKKMIAKNIDIEFPEKTHCKPEELNERKSKKWKTVRDAISHYPKIKCGESHEMIPNHAATNLKEINLERIRLIRKYGGSRSSLPKELQLACHNSKDGKKKVGYGDVYGIMDWDKPAPTLTGGCLSYSKGRFGHPEQDRAISAREAATLQTFDDNFIFEGNLQEIAQQIGNAVPVDMAAASGKYFVQLGKVLNII